MRPFDSPEQRHSEIERESSERPSLMAKLSSFIKQKIIQTVPPEPPVRTAEDLAANRAAQYKLGLLFLHGKTTVPPHQEYQNLVWQYNLEGYPLETRNHTIDVDLTNRLDAND